jgi:hypothetical protein
MKTSCEIAVPTKEVMLLLHVLSDETPWLALFIGSIHRE